MRVLHAGVRRVAVRPDAGAAAAGSTRSAVRRGLVGNLCRCTGYDSIIRAALATDRGDAEAARRALPARADRRRAVAAARRGSAASKRRRRKFYKPTASTRACRFRGENPGCVVVAGGTDLGVVYNKRMRAIDVALSTAGLAELRGIRCRRRRALRRRRRDADRAGARGAGAPAGARPVPRVVRLAADQERRHARRQPRQRLADRRHDPGADGAGGGGRRRRRRAARGACRSSEFYTGYRKTVLGPDELVTGVRIPLPRAGEMFKLYKVSRRKDLDISSFGAAIWMRQSNGTSSTTSASPTAASGRWSCG